VNPEKQRRTFLSYSRQNKDFALKLAKELKSSGFPVWIDQLDIPTGARWDDELEKALKDCEIFMVILTPASSASDNVKDEIGYAIDTNKRILPILLENADVPLRLRRFQYVDFSNKSYEEGVESAKALLRSLTDTPTGFYPRVSPTEETSSKPETSPAKKPTGKPISKGVMFGVGGFLGVAVLAGIIFAVLSMGGNKTAAPAVESQVVVVTATHPPEPTKPAEQPTSAPAPTQEAEPTAAQVEPTDAPNTPTPEVQQYFTEEFNGDLTTWSTFIVDSSKDDPKITKESLDNLSVGVDSGQYLFNIPIRQISVYSIYDSFQYDDVRVDASVDSKNININMARLICRYSSTAGWYEFHVVNNGFYYIYYAKPNADGVIAYRSLANGASAKVKTQNAVNEYSFVCQGNEFSAYVNGDLVKTTTDDLAALRSGKVGVSISSDNQIPVIAGFDWVEISEPEPK